MREYCGLSSPWSREACVETLEWIPDGRVWVDRPKNGRIRHLMVWGLYKATA
jgi:hypothetical protein